MFSALRSKMSGQSLEAFGEGQQFPLTKQMIVSIQRHMPSMAVTDLSGYTFERRRSDYAAAKSDLVVYNENKMPVLHGREPESGPVSIWPY